jgi:HSP20 family protein
MFWLDELLRETSGARWVRAGDEVDWRPELDVFERPDGYLLCFAVPGVSREEIEILFAENVLTVRGTRTLQVPLEARSRQVELPRGRFERRVRLPSAIAADSIRTQLTQGLLLVHVPKPQGVQIRVQGS